MFCPVCRYEYLEGATECSDCRVPLVHVLPPEEPKQKSLHPRLLKLAALSAIIGMSYAFLVKTINTIFPGMFINPTLAGVNAVLILIAQLTVAFFFVCFYREYVHDEQKKLKTAALLAIIAALVMVPLSILGVLSFVSNTVILPHAPVRIISTMILAWAGAAVLLYFFIVFYKEISSAPSKPLLKKVVFWAAAGAGVILLRQTLTALYYYYQSTSGHAVDFSSVKIYLILSGIPLVIFPIVTMLIFFISIYREKPPVPAPGS